MESNTFKIITLFLFLTSAPFLPAEEKSSLEEGNAYFLNKDYPKAVIYLDQALQNKDETKTTEILNKLAICYLEIAKDPKQNEKNRIDHFEKAEFILHKLNDLDKSEEAQLALARTYITHGIQLKNPEAVEKGMVLLKSLEDKDYSKLLLAHASSDYTERKKYYTQITNSPDSTMRMRALGWYFKGLNDLEEGGAHLYDAITSFEHAFSLFSPKDIGLSALCLKYKAEAFANLNSREGNLKALSELNLLIQYNHGNLLASLEDPGEVYFLRGLAASRLSSDGAGARFGEIAEKSLLEGLTSYPKSSFRPETMRTLGILYFQQQRLQEAGEIFEKLVKTYTTSSEAAEAHLWLSLCFSGEKGKFYLKKLYTDYPQSKYADEAYFRYYSFEEYLKGSEEAMEHLSHLQEKFPDSGYLVISNYLQGYDLMKKNDLEAAADYFEKSEKTFLNLTSENEKLQYFEETANQSAIERAFILLDLERMDESEIILKRLFYKLKDTDSISTILEKASYHLVKIYVKEGHDEAAENIISLMLKIYEQSNINEGYYISRFWYEQGMIAFRENSPKEALHHLRLSESAAKGDVLDQNELLDLWIQQSLCHLELGEMDKSMLILSRVANYNAASSLRVKAMYLRAQIYERQGRHELAKKQLQATSTKGGEWALKAKQKLEKDYVLQHHAG